MSNLGSDLKVYWTKIDRSLSFGLNLNARDPHGLFTCLALIFPLFKTLTSSRPHYKCLDKETSAIKSVNEICFFNCFSHKPFKFNGFLIFYNLAMALLNLFICLRLLTASYRLGYNYMCEPCRQVSSPDEMQVRGFLTSPQNLLF